jgi:ATP-dependent DNA helicase RecG
MRDPVCAEGWTVERLLKRHTSKPYNPLIAGAFFRTGDIESWGRGIDKVRDACRESDVEFPSFEFEKTGLMVEFKRRITVEESRGEAFEVTGYPGKKPPEKLPRKC